MVTLESQFCPFTKLIAGGWGVKPKQLPPYQVVAELVLWISLVANVLDSFRLFCGPDLTLG
ncbi:hypothetical protein DFP72DRAFT_929840, partial [Ephemerocybe angulata]